LDLESELLLYPLPHRPPTAQGRAEPHVVECLADRAGELRIVARHHFDGGRVHLPGGIDHVHGLNHPLDPLRNQIGGIGRRGAAVEPLDHAVHFEHAEYAVGHQPLGGAEGNRRTRPAAPAPEPATVVVAPDLPPHARANEVLAVRQVAAQPTPLDEIALVGAARGPVGRQQEEDPGLPLVGGKAPPTGGEGQGHQEDHAVRHEAGAGALRREEETALRLGGNVVHGRPA